MIIIGSSYWVLISVSSYTFCLYAILCISHHLLFFYGCLYRYYVLCNTMCLLMCHFIYTMYSDLFFSLLLGCDTLWLRRGFMFLVYTDGQALIVPSGLGIASAHQDNPSYMPMHDPSLHFLALNPYWINQSEKVINSTKASFITSPCSPGYSSCEIKIKSHDFTRINKIIMEGIV